MRRGGASRWLAGAESTGGRGSEPDEPGPADVRLLVPALVAWAAVAACLGLPAPVLLLAATGLVAGVLGGALVARRRGTPISGGARGGWPGRGPPRSVGRWLALAGLTAVAVALALLALAAQSELRDVGPVDELATARASVTLDATVAAEPRRVAQRPGPRGETQLVVVRLDVERVSGRGLSSQVHTPVLVLGDTSWADLSWMERIRVTGRLAPSAAGDDVVAVLNPGPPPTDWTLPVRSAGPPTTSGPGSASRPRAFPQTPAACCLDWSSATRLTPRWISARRCSRPA